MTTSRLVILLAVLLGGLSTVFLLPEQVSIQPLGIELELPEAIGEWWGEDREISERERTTLGPETEFARKSYTNGRGDKIHVTTVLAGTDMNTSIHRPERCLPAQGWSIANNASKTILVPGRQPLSTTRLHNLRTVSSTDGKPIMLYNVAYYWFVGYTDITNSHFQRTLIDVRDRLMKGYNQRWAYITVSAEVTSNLQKFGRNEKETDMLLQQFIRQLVPTIHKQSSF